MVPDFVAVLSQAEHFLELYEIISVVPDVGDVELGVVGGDAMEESSAVHLDVCVDRGLADGGGGWNKIK